MLAGLGGGTPLKFGFKAVPAKPTISCRPVAILAADSEGQPQEHVPVRSTGTIVVTEEGIKRFNSFLVLIEIVNVHDAATSAILMHHLSSQPHLILGIFPSG